MAALPGDLLSAARRDARFAFENRKTASGGLRAFPGSLVCPLPGAFLPFGQRTLSALQRPSQIGPRWGRRESTVGDIFSVSDWPDLCRFLDAGDTETLRTLSRPASEKRRGTKSRQARRTLGGERHGDLELAPNSMVSATMGRDLHACTGAGKRARRASRPGFGGYRRAGGGLMAWIESRKVAPVWSQRNGTEKRRCLRRSGS